MTAINRLYLSPPYLTGAEMEFVKEAMASNWIAPLGPMVDAFESEIASYTGANNAVAVSSGTAAIHLALVLLGVKPGDEVICSSFTFAGSAFPIVYVGATPIFVDSEERSWNMSPELLEKAIIDRIRKGKKPAAAIIVHLYGQSADLDPLLEICARYGVPVIEDAAESLGGLYKGKHTGTLGAFGVLSFNGNKIITSSGGGMLLCRDAETARRAKFLATQARENFPYYEHCEVGYNYRMSNIVAAIGRGQLATIEDRVHKRRAIFDCYVRELGGLPGLVFMPEPAWGRSNRWLTCLVIDPLRAGATNEAIRAALEKENIESRPLWKPMHLQPIFKNNPVYANGVSQRLFEQGLCLPSGTAMHEDDIRRVSSLVKICLGR